MDAKLFRTARAWAGLAALTALSANHAGAQSPQSLPGVVPLVAVAEVEPIDPLIFRLVDCPDNDEKCNYGPCPCQERKTLMQWSYGTSFEGGPPSMDEPLVGDRPDFTESSQCVGRGVWQLEMGYTYTGNNDNGFSTAANDSPQALLRVGMFADWFEFRIGQNYTSQNNSPGFDASGLEDLYLGVKLGLTPQEGFLPESALIIQMTVPTGDNDVSAGATLPGVNYCYGWTIIEDRLELGAGTQLNQSIDDGAGMKYWEFAQSFSFGIPITEKLGSYVEWFVLAPSGAETVGTQHYLDGGFTYSVTNNLQLDIEAGVGLSEASDDYFVGSGLIVRF